jgi:hypothetical protein
MTENAAVSPPDPDAQMGQASVLGDAVRPDDVGTGDSEPNRGGEEARIVPTASDALGENAPDPDQPVSQGP